MKEKVIAFAKMIDNISFKLNGLSSICIIIITILILAEIIARKFFNYGFLFVLEITTYLLAISWFFSAAYTLRTGGHIRVDILTSIIKSDRVLRFLEIFATILGIILSLIFFRALLILASDSYFFNKTSFSPLRTPLYIPQTFLVIGMFFMLIQMIMRLILLLINEKTELSVKDFKKNEYKNEMRIEK